MRRSEPCLPGVWRRRNRARVCGLVRQPCGVDVDAAGGKDVVRPTRLVLPRSALRQGGRGPVGPGAEGALDRGPRSRDRGGDGRRRIRSCGDDGRERGWTGCDRVRGGEARPGQLPDPDGDLSLSSRRGFERVRGSTRRARPTDERSSAPSTSHRPRRWRKSSNSGGTCARRGEAARRCTYCFRRCARCVSSGCSSG